MRSSRALAAGLLLVVLGACAPRNKVGDRVLGQASITNGRAPLTGVPSTPPP